METPELTEDYWIGLKYVKTFIKFDSIEPHEARATNTPYIMIGGSKFDLLGLKWSTLETEHGLPGRGKKPLDRANADIKCLKWIGSKSDEYLTEPRHILALAAARANVRAENSTGNAGTSQPGQSQERDVAASVEG